MELMVGSILFQFLVVTGLNFATTNIMTLFDTKKPLDFFMPKQRIGLSYSKKFKNEVELTFGGNLLAERTVIVPFMLKYKRYGIGGEMRLDLTDPMKFVESVSLEEHNAI